MWEKKDANLQKTRIKSPQFILCQNYIWTDDTETVIKARNGYLVNMSLRKKGQFRLFSEVASSGRSMN